jgi:hypothetical protein
MKGWTGMTKDRRDKRHDGEALIRLCEEQIQGYLTDQNGAYYVIWPHKDNKHGEVLPVRNEAFKHRLAKTFRANEKYPPSNAAIEQATMQIEAHCSEQAPRCLYSRIGWHNGSLFYDTGYWESIQIKPGYFGKCALPPIFKRNKHQVIQDWPKEGGSVHDVFHFVNIKEVDRCLFLTALGSYFIPNIPHPAMIFQGEQGTGKSSNAKRAVSIVDNSKTPLLTPPKDIQTAQINAGQHYIYAIDNVSYLSQWQSDFLCSIITGVGAEKRTLYKDDESFIRTYQNCVIINSISSVVYRPDLLDRSLIFKLPLLKKHKSEKELEQEWNAKKPYILGAFLIAISKAMQRINTIELQEDFRMADYAKWGVCLASEFGFTEKQFIDDYRRNINNKWIDIADNDPVISGITQLLDSKDSIWEGTMSELLMKLQNIKGYPNYELPKGANALSNKLDRMAAVLRNIGIRIIELRRKPRKRAYRIERI